MRPLSSRSRFLYRCSTGIRRLCRSLRWLLSFERTARTRTALPLPHVVATHRSLLLRKLSGTDMKLQRNKVESLRIACALVDSMLIGPGETFSFWRTVGRPGRSRGFPPGLQLSFGSLVEMEGGGLCQLSNLLHWMVLHTPLTVTERHRHSTDPFPDYRRTVPFGTGATVFYNYLDLSFRNGTGATFQLRTWLDDEYLNGEIRASVLPESSFEVVEKGHGFRRQGGTVFRVNELWRIERDRSSGEATGEELLLQNRCEVLYDVPEGEIT